MSDISKINISSGTYNIKDTSALKDVSISGNTLKSTFRSGTTVSVTPVEGIYGNAVNKASGTAANTTSGSYKSAIWRVDLKDVSLYDGLTIFIKVPVAGNGTYGTMLRIDGTDAADDTNLNLYPVCTGASSMISTRYAVNAIVGLTYDSVQAGATCYNAGTKYVTTATGTGWTKPGCWKVLSDYDSGNDKTVAYNLYSTYKRVYNGTVALTRYKIVALDKDNRVMPLTVGDSTGSTKTTNTTSFRPEHIYLFNSSSTTSIAAGSVLTASTLYNLIATTYSAYTFNESLATYRHIYLCGDYDKETGLFTLLSAALTMANGSTTRAANLSYFTQVPTNTANINLKAYFATGKYYIYLGATYSTANYLQLENNKPMFYFDGTNLIPAAYIDNGEENILESIKVNGTTLSITNKTVDIPLATSTAGVVKTTSTTTSTTGLVATPIISGVPYYKDTTYTFAEGANDGTIKVTPSGGTAQNVQVHNAVTTTATLTANTVILGNGNKTVTLLANGTSDLVLLIKNGIPAWSTFSISGVLTFVGVSTTDPKGSSGATVTGHTTWKKGDVVLYGTKEYVLQADGNVAANWVELGDEEKLNHIHNATLSNTHKHNIPTVDLGSHKHTFTIEKSATNHSHSVTDNGHTHSFSGSADHKHTISLNTTQTAHSHGVTDPTHTHSFSGSAAHKHAFTIDKSTTNHSHSVTDNGHTHSFSGSAAHKHTISLTTTQTSHGHTVTDNGHTHSFSGSATHQHAFTIEKSSTNHSHSVTDSGHTHSFSGSATHKHNIASISGGSHKHNIPTISGGSHSHSYDKLNFAYDTTNEKLTLSWDNTATTGNTSITIANVSTANANIGTITNVSTADATVTISGNTGSKTTGITIANTSFGITNASTGSTTVTISGNTGSKATGISIVDGGFAITNASTGETTVTISGNTGSKTTGITIANTSFGITNASTGETTVTISGNTGAKATGITVNSGSFSVSNASTGSTTITISGNTGSKTTGITIANTSFGITNASTGTTALSVSNVSTADATITVTGTTSLPISANS